VIIPLAVTRANVWAPTRGVSAIVRLDDFAPSRPLPDGLAAARSTTETPATKAIRKAGCRLDFFFMVRISDERMILVLFKSASQQNFDGPAAL
jgi:hypothetical protein